MKMTWTEQTLLNPNRVRQTTQKDDHRLEFERDYGRAIFSTPVKRLQHKAQVFPLEPHDAVRTRLTHSLEVSSVARSLGSAIGKWLLGKEEILEENDARAIEAIAATCGLLHDIGNPPFGHSGENAIRSWFAKPIMEQELRKKLDNNAQCYEDFLKFEGNAQTIRLVTKLQILADYYGLNLTYGTLSALCKYTAKSHEADDEQPDKARKKPGYFASENERIKDIREQTGTGDHRNPITFLVEAADDIVYSVADVEDAVKKRVFTWKELQELLEKDKLPSVLKALKKKDKILSTGDNPSELPDDVFASAFRTGAIIVLVKSTIQAFKVNYDQIIKVLLPISCL